MSVAQSYSDLLNESKRAPEVLAALVRVRNHAVVLVEQYQQGEDIDDAVAALELRIALADEEVTS